MDKLTQLGISATRLPLAQLPEVAVSAERAGFESIWYPEIASTDAFVPLTVVAHHTQRIRLATGIVGIWSRSPSVMALSAATLNHVSHGRFKLGLSRQNRYAVENWHGRKSEDPLRAVREYVGILRKILAGESVAEEGVDFRTNFQMFAPPPESPIPIYLAALGPKMLQLAGEIADGIFGAFYSERYIKDVVLPNLEIGAKRAGRSLNDIDIGSMLHSVITEDDSGLELIKGQIMSFSTLPHYAEIFRTTGFGDQAQEIRDLVSRGEVEAALQTIDDEMADSFTISGSPDHARKRVEAYFSAGLNTIALQPVCPGTFSPFYKGQFPESVRIPEFSLPDFMAVVQRTIDCFAV